MEHKIVQEKDCDKCRTNKNEVLKLLIISKKLWPFVRYYDKGTIEYFMASSGF